MPIIHPLTGLRFFAALGVVLAHFAMLLHPPAESAFVFVLGGDGVGLFFVLSGFVIAGNLHGRNAGRIRIYARERIARIVPLYWLLLLACLGLYLTMGFGVSLHRQPAFDPQQATVSFLLNVAALQAWVPDAHVQQFWNAPGWSISSEFFFYAIAPWLVPLMCRLPARARWFGIGIGGALLFALYYGLAARHLPPDVAAVFPLRLPIFGLLAFACGVALYAGFSRAGPRPPRRTPGGLAVVVLVLLAAAWIRVHLLPGVVAQVLWFYGVIVPIFAWLIREVALCEGLSARLLGHPIMQTLGHASYALYLGHWLVLALAMHTHPEGISTLRFLVWLVLMVAASVLLYHGFEAPARRWSLRALGASRR